MQSKMYITILEGVWSIDEPCPGKWKKAKKERKDWHWERKKKEKIPEIQMHICKKNNYIKAGMPLTKGVGFCQGLFLSWFSGCPPKLMG